MNVKNFLVAGIVGGIVDFLLGAVLWGMLGPSLFCCKPANPSENMMLVGLGCLMFGMIFSYIYVKWAGITDAMSGLKSGAVLGLFLGIMSNAFQQAMMADYCVKNFTIDTIFHVICGAAVGAVVALVNGKMK